MWARSPWAAGTGPVLAAAVPVLVFEYLRARPALDMVLRAPAHHFAVVTAASLLAGVVAAVIGLAGWRQRNLQVTFVGLAFMSLAFIFALHGFSTPGFVMGPTSLPSAAAQLSVLTCAVWLAFSVASSGSGPVRAAAGRQRWLVPGWAAALAALWAASLRWPRLWDGLAGGGPGTRWVLAGLTLALLALAAVRYWQSYLYTRFPLQLAMVFACAWLASAQYIMAAGTVWRASWWIYHGLLVLAAGALVVGLLRQYGMGTSLAEAAVGLWTDDPVRRLRAGLSESVRALVLALEARDPYTAGHSYRVALSAVRMGQAMGLPGHLLRALAQGAMLHDVGKFEVPEAVLNKPGPLTPEERRLVEQHPVAGYRIASRLGLPPEELGIVRHHHERWDGTGYPDGLEGEQIPLLARIVAVADVYDALTSERAYRPAWSHQQARTYILDQAGRQFDPHCVRVWAELTQAGPIVQPLAQPAALRPVASER